jgi:lipopolysaccharide assembly outer membrane protein LptD (OstA)
MLKRAFYFLLALALVVGLGSADAQKGKGKRPARKAKVQDTRIYLVHADVLHFDDRINPDATILNGSVHFTHQGARLYCDSAYFYEASNSFEAFGHVKMYQGDTLSLVSEYAYYDGNEQMARARYNVVLKHKKTTLYTDSLDFDRLYDNAYFFEGGKMIDGNTTLTSDWGEYNTKSKMSVFNYDVKMQSPSFYLTTDTLYYDTRTSIAHIVGPSNITSGESHIYSEQGYYDTKLERARLMNRSVLSNNGRTMVGDSVYYDSQQGFSQAFRNVVYVDSVNKNKLTGNYGEYWEPTGYALCTDSAVAIDYSQGDSLYMHADTFKVVTFNIDTDSVYRKIHAFHHVRAYRTDVQAVCDSLVYNSLDSCMTMYYDPIIWNNNQQLVGDLVKVFLRDSVIDHAHIIDNCFSIQHLRTDTACYNQVSSKEMFAYFKDGEIREAQAKGNVLIGYFFEEGDSVPIIYNYQETAELRMFLKDRKLESVWTPKTSGTMYPINQIPDDRRRLQGFMWYDYIRPLNRDDIFNWRGKK